MGSLYPQIFFDTPGMTAVFVVVMLVEAASLSLLWLVTHEFRKMCARHARLFEAISDDGQHKKTEKHQWIIFWVYIISTFVISIVTTSLFLFEPHII